MRSLLILSLLLWLSLPAFSQTNITWEMLADLKYVETYMEDQDTYEYLPEFNASLKALEGKEVAIKGFMLPIDPENGIYVLSKNPFSSCFFCGAGGLETVVELFLKPGHGTFEQDEVLTMKGKLKLNNDDFDYLIYILEGAECYSSEK